MAVTIIGGGLAGADAAWQAASADVPVVLHEMRPGTPTAVHKTDRFAELVCSNSFRGDKLDNAVGLLKEEMRRLGSLVMRAAHASRVPAGAALAVDRDRFAAAVTRALIDHPLITIVREEITSIPETTGREPVIVATGPLTSDALSSDIAALVGADHLYFYDAISPIVLADTIDRSRVFRASRWDRSLRGVRLKPDTTDDSRRARRTLQRGRVRLQPEGPADEGSVRLQPDQRINDSAACGVDDGAGDYLNCPFTREEYERFYDALVAAESATVLDATWQVRGRPMLFFAGQMSGVEGYVESAASGLIAGLNAAALVKGAPVSIPPRTTAIGALAYYVAHANPAHYEPSNITFGIMPPRAEPPRSKMARI